VPRPTKKDKVGEWVLKNYAKATHYIGLHFAKYDEFIFHPVVKKEILNAEPKDKYHITVYLPSFCEPQLENIFHNFRDFHFEIFTKQRKIPKPSRNITFLPVDKNLFNRSLIHCAGIITGGGFETPAEAIHLGKKIMCIPIRGQYEQICNVAALEKLGITCLRNIDETFPLEFYNWLFCKKSVRIDYSKTIRETLEYLFSTKEKINRDKSVVFEKVNKNSDFLVE
jgi:uncharacterized protein (TIGR00661 family)